LGELYILFYNWFKDKKCTPMLAPYDITLKMFIPVKPDTYSGIKRTGIPFFKGHLNYPNSYLSIYKK
ncbi:MAG: hypothetical protein Q8N27_06535, partial [Candidatus Hydromicrobium sp.]|nr:hypothetical protein [Candidatus Hydromicrobium sp.]